MYFTMFSGHEVKFKGQIQDQVCILLFFAA